MNSLALLARFGTGTTTGGGAPSDPTPAFWLDASQETGSDGASITPTDLGSLGLTITGTVTLKTSVLNGENVLRFNGSSQRLVAGTTSSFNFLHEGDEWTIVIVAKTRLTSPNAYYALMDNTRTSGSQKGISIFYDDRNTRSRNDVLIAQIGRAVANSYPMQAVTEDDGFPSGEWNIQSIQHDQRKNARNAGHVWQNGSYKHTDFNNYPTDTLGAHATGDATYALAIGSLGGTATGYFDGDLAELRVYNRRLTIAEHAAVLDELATKWGLTVDYPIPQFPIENSSTYDAFGFVVRADNDDLIAIARSGPSHGASQGDLKQWTSTDDGETWSTSTLKTAVDTDYRNAAGGATPSGALVAFYGIWDDTLNQWDSLAALRSTDNGNTWSDVSLGSVTTEASYSPYGPLVALPSGALLQTFYETDGSSSYKVFTLKSTDDGLTWGDRVNIYSGATEYTETSMVRVSGATDAASVLLAFARRNTSSSSIRQFKSTDGGATWSDMGDVPGSNFTSVNGVMAHPVLVGPDLYLLVTDRGGTSAIQLFTGSAADVVSSVANWGSATRLMKAFGTDLGYAFSAYLTSDSRSLMATAYQAYAAAGGGSTDADLWLFGVPIE